MADPGVYDSDSEILSTLSDINSETDSILEADEPAERPEPEQSSAATQAAKAIQAAEENIPDAVPEATASLVSVPRTPTWADEQTPLLDAGPAPPDYAAATAWRRSSALANNESRSGVGSEQRPLLSQGSPSLVDQPRRPPHYSSNLLGDIESLDPKSASTARQLCYLWSLACLLTITILTVSISIFQGT